MDDMEIQIVEEEQRRGWIDVGLEKVMSRKLLVFILTTVFFVLTLVTAEQWIMIAVAYVSVQGIVDVIARLKGM